MKARMTFAHQLPLCLGLVVMSSLPAAGPAAAAPAGPTFDMVIQAPDDPQLNLAYAEAEANAGRLLNAAAALERVLLTRPGANGVRLYYAVVLYRLDDLQGAEQQLRLLANAQLMPLQAAERDRYLRIVQSGRKTFRVSGQVAAGIDYQSDAAGALTAQFDVPGSVVSSSGAGAVLSGRLDATLELQPALDIYASASAYNRSDVSGPDNDLRSFAGQLGISGAHLMTSWKLGGVIRHYDLFNDPYLTEYGGQLQASVKTDTATTFTARFEGVRQEYEEPIVDALFSSGTLNGTHDGWHYDAGLGVSYRLDARSTFGLSGGYQWKTASYRPFAYDAPYMQGNYHRQLNGGVYVDLTGRMMFVDYRARDPVFLGPAPGATRKSTISDVRFAVGMPLNIFTELGATGNALEGITIEAVGNYTHRAESLPVADYGSFGGSLNLIWRFGDGT